MPRLQRKRIRELADIIEKNGDVDGFEAARVLRHLADTGKVDWSV